MFTYSRRYRGDIEAVLLDWAGTTMSVCVPGPLSHPKPPEGRWWSTFFFSPVQL